MVSMVANAGNYIVGYTQERAKGMYMLTKEGQLEWTEVNYETCHLEVLVSDSADGRFISYLNVQATLTDKNDEVTLENIRIETGRQ